jgi:hypothetical protein
MPLLPEQVPVMCIKSPDADNGVQVVEDKRMNHEAPEVALS